MKFWPRLLGPAIPGDAAAYEECDTCCDNATPAEPGQFAEIGENQLSNLDRDEDYPHALKTQHEEEVDPVDAVIAAEVCVNSMERGRCDRCLLDDELFCNGKSKAKHQ